MQPTELGIFSSDFDGNHRIITLTGEFDSKSNLKGLGEFIIILMNERDLEKAALRGEPSYVWRAGQQRRLKMILHAAEERICGTILENGCGVGMYVEHLAPMGGKVFGLEYDFERAAEAGARSPGIVNAAGEHLPYPDSSFDLILSHEVLEHVADDVLAVREMVRVLRSPDGTSGKPGGRVVIFVPNRGYPFETHGIYWRGKYSFGNKPFVNYLPRAWRDQLAPHVRIYTQRDLEKLFTGLPVKWVERTIVFGAYDNIIARFGAFGKLLRTLLQALEKTPLKALGLSHVWVVEKTSDDHSSSSKEHA
jgi:SAM-dependent methyltransferase